MLDNNPHYLAINAAFPHIGEKLKLYWGHQEFARYMHGLLHDTRDGTRRGFPMDALLALYRLSELHDRAYPHLVPPADMWTHEKPADKAARGTAPAARSPWRK